MKQIVFCLTMLLASWCLAQQQGQPPPYTQQPPYGTPPTFPEGRQAPGNPSGRSMPPDEKAPPPRAMSTKEVQQQITNHLNSEPALANTNLAAQVSAKSVVLTGNVATAEQHDLARRIAQSYAGDRKLVDKIKLRQQT